MAVQQRPTTAEEVEEIMGIAVLDPDILKATQFVMVTVGISAFFLLVQLTATFERTGLPGFSTWQVAWWVMDMMIMILLVFFGYVGVKRSSRCFLAVFFLLSFVAFVEDLVEACFALEAHVVAGDVALQFIQAVYFVIGMHYARYLWKEAGRRPLHEAAPTGQPSNGYTMMGINMLDLKVLKSTQLVFTSIAIVGSVFGSWIIVSAQPMLTDESSRGFWLVSVTLFVGWVLSGYFGIRKSSPGLLRCFSRLALVFCFFFAASFALGVMVCFAYCWTQSVLGLGITAAFFVAWRHSLYLKDKAVSGVVLTAPVANGASAGVTAPVAIQMGAPTLVNPETEAVV